MFSAFFATYAVLSGETAGGPSGKDLFNLTMSRSRQRASCSRASLAASPPSARGLAKGLMYYGGMALTFVFGAGFLFIEIHEFVGMIDRAPGRPAAPSSRPFLLVGCHGVHVTLGLLWLLTMVAQVFAKGYRADILRRVLCFGLFWHTLDIIWVAIFTVVYLLGAG
jgi:cytochrome o ubiquinol oxidase subunit 3